MQFCKSILQTAPLHIKINDMPLISIKEIIEVSYMCFKYLLHEA